MAPASIFAMDFDTGASVIWAIDSVCAATCTGTTLGNINQATGAFTAVGPITGALAGTNFAGIKFDPTSSNVYMIGIAGGASQFYSLNLTTRVATQIGPNIPGLVIDIAISNSGVVYGHDISLDRIVTIDKTTGAVTPVGLTGINANFAQGMDFDPSDNTLYAFVIQASQAAAIGTINLTTGAFTSLTVNGEELEGAIDVPSCVAPAAPTGTLATASAPNQITVTWTAVPGATGYNVYRAAGTCPQTNYTLVAPNVPGTTFTNTGLSGGSTFAYVVRSLVGGCESRTATAPTPSSPAAARRRRPSPA